MAPPAIPGFEDRLTGEGLAACVVPRGCEAGSAIGRPREELVEETFSIVGPPGGRIGVPAEGQNGHSGEEGVGSLKSLRLDGGSEVGRRIVEGGVEKGG